MILALLAPAYAFTSVQAQFQSTIAQVEQMVWDGNVTQMAGRHGLDVVNVTWEDTGRNKGSAVGPNISDMTIGVRDAYGQLHPMPVLRFDNFTDTTADVRSDSFWLRVGNERGGRLRSVSLADVLQDTRSFLSDPWSWSGRGRSLWSARDETVLVSAQACFLPIPRDGEATFMPVLYNYQSYPDNPAVLTMVATREGTSIQVIENEGGYLSETLSFNQNGERAPFTATRLSDFRDRGGDGTWGSVNAAGDDGLNMVLLVQVPLKQKPRPTPMYEGYGGAMDEMSAAPMSASKSAGRRSDVESAVIGHGLTEGPYKELDGLAIERDTRFPVRVTVQFYKATSNGVVTEADIREVRRQIDRVYSEADYVGSLVTQGYTGRPTEWVAPYPDYPRYRPQPQPQPSEDAQWSDPFWSWHKSN
ncbi:MAG: hypothetical protein Q8P18_33770 [Pseudomonadota bacterium]|nr:hypothetical protein [Pseudomonadota bacterium]